MKTPWEDLRLYPKVGRSLDPAHWALRWTSELRPSPVLVLEGPASRRAEAHAWLRQREVPLMGRDGWLAIGAFEDLTFHVSRVGGSEWHLLWSLCDVEDFVVDEPLRRMIDRGNQYTELFQAIWEIRFLLDEGHDVRPHVEALTGWLTEGEPTPLLQSLQVDHRVLSIHQRTDLMLFLLALGQQNSLVDAPIFVFDGLERALEFPHLMQGLLEIVGAVTNWAPVGSPAGVLVGVTPQGAKAVRSEDPQLAKALKL